MMVLLDPLIAGFVAFIRSFIGIIVKPYDTYRRIISFGSLWELPYIGLLLVIYFAVSSLVKTAAFRPFLLTRHFVILSTAALVTYLFMLGLLYIVSRLITKSADIKKLALGWGYTLIPTVSWFLLTSVLYVVLPPPRTERVWGITFSILYLIISTTLLFWKIILSYLTLRFSMKLDLLRIVLVLIITIPFIGLYSVFMYRMGIFKIPFV